MKKEKRAREFLSGKKIIGSCMRSDEVFPSHKELKLSRERGKKEFLQIPSLGFLPFALLIEITKKTSGTN